MNKLIGILVILLFFGCSNRFSKESKSDLSFTFSQYHIKNITQVTTPLNVCNLNAVQTILYCKLEPFYCKHLTSS